MEATEHASMLAKFTPQVAQKDKNCKQMAFV
jgi:hypothetical protein